MPDNDRLIELLMEWEERRQQGDVLSAEQLGANDPELLDQLRVRLRKRLALQAFLDQSATPTSNSGAGELPDQALPKIDGFEILEVIGSGGMGVVYKARDLQLRRLVALKMVRSGTVATPQELQRFRREAEAVAQFQHPNIVPIYEVGEQDGRPFLALEYVEGGNLAVHAQAKPLPPRIAADLLVQLAGAVQHAHEKGIVHRDLKPANVLLDECGTPKITDFGLAKRLDADLGLTQTGAILGSPCYMAPEQAEGKIDAIGPMTDIYALGAILYELLAGRPPFNGTSVLETLEHVRTLDPVSPRKMQPGVPKDLETICLKCLEKRADDRYASAADLAHDLHLFLMNEPIAARPPSASENLVRALRRRNYDPKLHQYGFWLVLVAPFPLIVHALVLVGLRDDPNRTHIIAWTSIGFFFLLHCFFFWLNRSVLSAVPAGQRRLLNTVWVGNWFTMVMIWITILLVLPPHPPEHHLIAYPLWLILLGFTFFALAHEVGWFYLAGAAAWVLALIAIAFLDWSPLIVAATASLNLLFHGLAFLFLARQRKGSATPLVKA